jgi:putative Ca2+/H+ antiporter (TMEM165/GDT1 family)
MSYLTTISITVFIAELGDKTQIATLLFATDRQVHPMMVFMAAALALVASVRRAGGDRG